MPAAAVRQKGLASCRMTRRRAWFCNVEDDKLLWNSLRISQIIGYREERQRCRHKHQLFLSRSTEAQGAKRIRNPCSLDRQQILYNRTPDDTMATFEIKVIACDKYLRWSMRFNATIPAKPYHFLILYFSQWAPWYW